MDEEVGDHYSRGRSLTDGEVLDSTYPAPLYQTITFRPLFGQGMFGAWRSNAHQKMMNTGSRGLGDSKVLATFGIAFHEHTRSLKRAGRMRERGRTVYATIPVPIFTATAVAVRVG